MKGIGELAGPKGVEPLSMVPETIVLSIELRTLREGVGKLEEHEGKSKSKRHCLQLEQSLSWIVLGEVVYRKNSSEAMRAAIRKAGPVDLASVYHLTSLERMIW